MRKGSEEVDDAPSLGEFGEGLRGEVVVVGGEGVFCVHRVDSEEEHGGAGRGGARFGLLSLSAFVTERKPPRRMKAEEGRRNSPAKLKLLL